MRALLGTSQSTAQTNAPVVETSDAPLLTGSAPAMQPAFAAIAHATASDAPVLVTGPTGIGKSLAAAVCGGAVILPQHLPEELCRIMSVNKPVSSGRFDAALEEW